MPFDTGGNRSRDYFQKPEKGTTRDARSEVGPIFDATIRQWFVETRKPAGGRIAAEYVWIGGTGTDLRSKGRTLDKKPTDIKDLPLWNYDGSSTYQAPGTDSEVYLKACKIYRDPIRGGDNILVMSDTYEPPKLLKGGTMSELKAIPTNTRYPLTQIMKKVEGVEPIFQLEQEYTLLNSVTKWPLGWSAGGLPKKGDIYFGCVGAAVGRDIAEVHYRACLYAGIKISSYNASVLPGRWEYSIGPCAGADIGDDVWMSRYLAQRIGELYNVTVAFEHDAVPGDWSSKTSATMTPGEKTHVFSQEGNPGSQVKLWQSTPEKPSTDTRFSDPYVLAGQMIDMYTS